LIKAVSNDKIIKMKKLKKFSKSMLRFEIFGVFMYEKDP